MASIGHTPGTHVIGKVSILYGTVKAVSPDGTVRVLAPTVPFMPMIKLLRKVTAVSPSF